MSDMLLSPDSRPRRALATRNRLLEQSMKYMTTVQRKAMQQKKGDVDAQITALTKLTASIAQIARLHHQISKGDQNADDKLVTMLRMLGLDENNPTTKEVP